VLEQTDKREAAPADAGETAEQEANRRFRLACRHYARLRANARR
jgi:hypothetical protein